MPQVWITYEELAEHMGATPAQARAHAIEVGLDRRRCGDGLTRVKLPPDFMLSYLADSPEVVRAVARRNFGPGISLPRQLDEAELTAAIGRGDQAAIAGPFTDALVSGLRSVLVHAEMRRSEAS